MSSLEVRVTVECPLSQADTRVRGFFRKHGNQDGDLAKLELRLPVTIPGTSAAGVERAVIATIRQRNRPGEMTPRYALSWAPAEPGPFPLFSGELVVGSDEEYSSFTLLLQGKYEPPMGVLGQGFDAVVGRHIAHATAKDLLAAIKNEVERAFLADEQQKQTENALKTL